MEPSTKVSEKQLYEIWENRSFNDNLTTVTGEKVTVIDVGVYDPDLSGPDFKNARIRIGNIMYVGDIEIDTNYNGWKSHGHNIDKNFNKTVLHLCLFNKYNQPFVYTKDGRKVPTACLSDYVEPEKLKNFQEHTTTVPAGNNKIKCKSVSHFVTDGEKEVILKDLAKNRLQKKCDRIYHRLKELSFVKSNYVVNEPVLHYELDEGYQDKDFDAEEFADKKIWQQLFYEQLFEALGYSKNKTIMLSLAKAVDLNFIERLGKDEKILEYIESALFNIAGIIPDIKTFSEPSNYMQTISDDWEILKRIYDGQTFNETEWYFFKLRPQNFPTLRIAGGARFIKAILYEELIEKIIKKFIEIKNVNVLLNSVRSLFVVKARGYWSDHYIFEKKANTKIKYFVGVSRANEILINVLLPFFSVYFDVFPNEDASRKLLKLYNILDQTTENRIVKEVAEGIHMGNYTKSAVYTQGMLELFRSFCSKDKCLECEIGKQLFD